MNSTPCLNWLEGGGPSGENALPAKTPRDTGRKRSTEGVTEAAEVTRGDTVHDVDSTKQHVRRERERVKQEDERVAALSCCRARGQRTGNTRWVCGRCRAALTAGLRRPSSSPLQVKCCCLLGCLVPFSIIFFFNFLPSHPRILHHGLLLPPPPHKSPCRLSYLLMMFLQRPSSFLMSATSWRRAAFSRSRKAARTEIWFSFSRRASRERLAASLFLTRRLQYFSSCRRPCMLGVCGEESGGGWEK